MTLSRVAVIFDNKARPDTTGVYCRRALGQLVDVEHFLPTELAQIPRWGFDLYLQIDDGLEYHLPSDLHPCAWWAIDTHLHLPWYLAKGQDFDFVFTAQRDGVAQLRQGGIDSATWLPLACDPDLHCRFPVENLYDFCFVGHLFPGPRTDLLALLLKQIPRAFVGQRFFEDMARTYSAAHLIFNRSIRNDINMRVFEALSCGSLLVTNDLRDNGQEELFQDGKHLATYREPEELIEKVHFFLSHPAERERIALAGKLEVQARHTYRHRMEQLLRTVEDRLVAPTVILGSDLRPQNPSSAESSGEIAPTSSRVTGDADPTNLDNMPRTTTLPNGTEAIAALIPEHAKKILVVGQGVDALAQNLRTLRQADVLVVDTNWLESQTTRHYLDQITVDQVEQVGLKGLLPGLDAIICTDVLERLLGPSRFLRRLRAWLHPKGEVIFDFPNLRHHHVQQAVLDGDWPYETDNASAREPLRWFTCRQVEKLLFRAGFHVAALRGIPGPDYAAWDQGGRPKEVKVGRLHVGGLSPQDAEAFYLSRYLVRAAISPEDDHGLTSIILLTYNQLDYTRRCVESIRRYTDEPYELIFVDNGSQDDTVNYLRSLGNVKLILNTENRGFPAGANQGIRAASGRQILLLNNDTIVTTGWLHRLLRALHSDPHIGLAGPCSNCVSGEQEIPVRYEGVSGIDGFAWEWGKTNDQVRQDTDRLIGFCLLFRREVIERIGLLDERFGVGCFEDDDFCLRTLRAGYRAVIARDAFVHHFGGRTFVASGVDYAGLLQKNQQLFRSKWSQPDSVSPRELAPAPKEDTTPTTQKAFQLQATPGGGFLLQPRKIRLSLCMIVRDNERTIEACLKSIRPWVDEMIVVDTGSKDNTPDIARRLGARVFHFPWCDCFSTARNESLRHARGKWIFWMDSDDTIDAVSGAKLRELVEKEPPPGVLGYVMQVHCPGSGPEGQTDVTVVDHLKLFRNRPDFRFEGRIHEQIIPAIRRAGGEIAWTDIFVVHSGYDHSPEGQERKKQRDLHLLHLELKERPEHPFTLFNLGMTYADIGKHTEAVDFLQRSIAHSGSSDSQLRKAYALLVQSQRQLGQMEDAWRNCQRALELFPNDIEMLFRKAALLHDRGFLPEAVAAYETLLTASPERYFSSVVQGLQGYLARHNLAVLFEELNDFRKAEEQWRRVVEERPHYRPGYRGLAGTLLRQGKNHDALELAERLAKDQRLAAEGCLIQAQVLQARGNFSASRRQLERAAQQWPNDPEVLSSWCRFLFESNELRTAEGVLKRLLALQPQDAAAHHNLGAVYLRTGRPQEATTSLRESLRLRPDSPATDQLLAQALTEGGRLT